MTREEFDNLLLPADREFALQKRLLERQLDARYDKNIGMGFRTPNAQAIYIEQLQASKEAELIEGLKNLRGDIEAKYLLFYCLNASRMPQIK